MEFVSVLAGERWSDRPSCTDPTLATVARVVNDEMSETARRDLAGVVIRLIGRRGDANTLAPTIVVACIDAVAAYSSRNSPPRRHRRRAARRVRTQVPRGWRRLSAGLYRRVGAQHAITAVALALRSLPTASRDVALQTLLDAAINATSAPQPAAAVATAEESAGLMPHEAS